MAIKAVLAIIADGGRGIFVIYREGVEINLFFLSFWFCYNPSTAASSNPLQRGSRGFGMFDHQNHAAGGGNGSIMVEMFVCLCLASQKYSEREFFVPARTDLGVKYFYSLSVNYKNPLPAVGNDS